MWQTGLLYVKNAILRCSLEHLNLVISSLAAQNTLRAIQQNQLRINMEISKSLQNKVDELNNTIEKSKEELNKLRILYPSFARIPRPFRAGMNCAGLT